MSIPEGTACLPRDSTEDEKSLVEAAILLYIARRDPIYIIYIPLFCFTSQNIVPSPIKRKRNAVDEGYLPVVQVKKKKKRFRQASELGLHMY